MGKTSSAVVVASSDRSIPTTYVGSVAPNYYCRGWNSKRDKYCGQRAGFGTTHVGVGRCKMHGGQQPDDGRLTRGGRHSSIEVPRIRELLDAYAQDPDPLNVVDDLLLARALMRNYVERSAAGGTQRIPERKLLLETLTEYEIAIGDEATDTQREQLEQARAAVESIAAERALPDVAEAIRYIDVISKIIHRVEMLRTAGAVSLDQVRRFLAAIDRELQLHVADEQLRDKLRRAFYAIRV